jgi:hypothetical protein
MAVLIRFSGYLAAGIILISWLINNLFVTGLQKATQTLDAVRGEQAELADLARINDLTEGQRALFKRVSALENGSHDEAKMDSDWVESLESNSVRLAGNAEELQNLVARVEPEGEGDLVQAIHETVDKAKHFGARIRSDAEAYRQGKSGESLDALQATDQEADGLDEALGGQYAKMEDYMEKKRERSAGAEETASMMAYLLSALGTGLGVAGKWLEKKRGRGALG